MMRPKSPSRRLAVLLALSLMFAFHAAAADQPPAEDLEFFEKRIRPVLIEHCYSCHSSSAKKVRGGLLLDTRSGIRAGGDSGAGVIPEDVDESLVLSALRYDSFEMPPAGKLSDQVIADFEHWILRGAADPRDGEVRKPAAEIDVEKGKEFWAFRPVQSPRIPDVSAADWPLSSIDALVLAQLERKSISPVADADRATLIRRAYYTLIGLPPTPAQIEAFLADDDPRAFAKVVDRLLESKHFGERWGRHWLDVVRYAESSGGGRTLLFPDAWRYRDYVIDAFNRDLPYDQFLREQIAGDLMEAKDWQQQRRQLVATAFLVLGPTNYELQDKDILEMDIVDEQIDTVGKAFLGMTLGCARCHDHKFDPIPMSDYYGLAGIFKSTKSVIHSNVSTWNTSPLPLPSEQEQALQRHEREVAALQRKVKEATKKLAEASPVDGSMGVSSLGGVVVDDVDADRQGSWVASTSVKGFVGSGYLHDNNQRDAVRSLTFAPDLPADGEYEILLTYTPGSNRSPQVPVTVQHVDGISTHHIDQTKPGSLGPLLSLGKYQLQVDSAEVVISNDGAAPGVVIADAVIFLPGGAGRSADLLKAKQQPTEDSLASLRERVEQLRKELRSLEARGPVRPIAMAVTDEAEVGDIPLAIRGVVHNQGPVIPRGVLQVASTEEFVGIPPHVSGRLELAQWMAHPSNPLTARVLVNRVWYWLFGEGLVRSVDNFGAMGEVPSHPELLDHLASEFMRDGWSVKQLIRKLMLSRVYQLQSRSDHEGQPLDPENRLWWRMHRQRLDAESIRDTLLFVAGRLDQEVGGSNIREGTKSEYGYQFDSQRRSVYLPVFRNALPEIFATFDFADPNVQGGKRTSSTIAPQALLLMNDPFVVSQSRAAAERLLAEVSISQEARITHCYQSILGRPPTHGEFQLVTHFLAQGDPLERWSLLVQTLFQSVDFRYLN